METLKCRTQQNINVKYVPVPPLTPVYMPHLPEQIKFDCHSHSLTITIMHVYMCYQKTLN